MLNKYGAKRKQRRRKGCNLRTQLWKSMDIFIKWDETEAMTEPIRNGRNFRMLDIRGHWERSRIISSICIFLFIYTRTKVSWVWNRECKRLKH